MLTTETAFRKDLNTGKADMQHRHFTTIAAIIRDIPRDADGHFYQRQAIAEHFADNLCGTNPKFDRARFLKACLNC